MKFTEDLGETRSSFSRDERAENERERGLVAIKRSNIRGKESSEKKSRFRWGFRLGRVRRMVERCSTGQSSNARKKKKKKRAKETRARNAAKEPSPRSTSRGRDGPGSIPNVSLAVARPAVSYKNFLRFFESHLLENPNVTIDTVT